MKPIPGKISKTIADCKHVVYELKEDWRRTKNNHHPPAAQRRRRRVSDKLATLHRKLRRASKKAALHL